LSVLTPVEASPTPACKLTPPVSPIKVDCVPAAALRSDWLDGDCSAVAALVGLTPFPPVVTVRLLGRVSNCVLLTGVGPPPWPNTIVAPTQSNTKAAMAAHPMTALDRINPSSNWRITLLVTTLMSLMTLYHLHFPAPGYYALIKGKRFNNEMVICRFFG
jgi:hypothetical protein